MRRWLKQHWVYVTAFGVGLILTPAAIRSAYATRGYFAIGGEYFIIPLMLLVAMLIDELKASMNVFAASTKENDMSADPVDKGGETK